MHRFVDLPLTFVAAAILSVALAAPSQGHRSAPLVVRSTSGTCKQSTVTVMLMRWKSRVDKLATEVHGTVNATVPGVRQWLAVPYVQPPVGALRWLSPEPLSSNATHHSLDVGTWGPSCIQFEPELTAYNDVLREYFTWGPMSEDCLTASIWAPLHPTKALLPIIIWIHGGGDVFGSANVPAQDPSKWVQRTQSHIVIRWVPTLVQIIANMLILSSICSIQYRLNIFGFPNSDGLERNNLAYEDQRAGVEWVRDNAASFGGDPDKMVMWGQSAGGQALYFYSAAHPRDPVVKGFFADSAGPPAASLPEHR